MPEQTNGRFSNLYLIAVTVLFGIVTTAGWRLYDVLAEEIHTHRHTEIEVAVGEVQTQVRLLGNNVIENRNSIQELRQEQRANTQKILKAIKDK